MDCNELVKRVRLVVNEAADDSDVSLLSADTRSLDDTITGLLPQAVLFVQMNKGTGRVNTKSIVPTVLNVVADVSGGGRIVLPDDFVKLVTLQLDGWMRPVTQLYPSDSREAMWQMNEHTRAGYCKPVCVESVAANGNRCALLFPFHHGVDKPACFVYEARFNATEGLEGYDDAMADAVVFECASLLYTVFERFDIANSLLAQALVACGGQMGKK